MSKKIFVVAHEITRPEVRTGAVSDSTSAAVGTVAIYALIGAVPGILLLSTNLALLGAGVGVFAALNSTSRSGR